MKFFRKFFLIGIFTTFAIFGLSWYMARGCNNDSIQQQQHVLFIVGGGSHIHPTYEIAKRLKDRGASVSFIVFDKTSKEGQYLQEIGVNTLSLWEEIIAINPQLSPEKKHILWNPASNFVDQPEGVLDMSILSQYFMALFWDELLQLVTNINPDAIVYDTIQGYWGEYTSRKLEIPAFASFAPALPTKWKDPEIKNIIKHDYFQKTYPATNKRIWAAEHLRKKLGSIGDDIDVDLPVAFARSNYSTFVYTYPKLARYEGEKLWGSNIVFAGYPHSEERALNPHEQQIIDDIRHLKKDKKLVFVSMGTDSSKPLQYFEMLAEALGNGDKNQSANDSILVALHPGNKVARGEKHNAKEVTTRIEELGHTNFMVFDYFPLPSFFNLVDVFIGHGGNNSSMQALHAQVPMLLLPIHGDQFDVAEVFQDFSLAKVIPISLNPMAAKSDFERWSKFASSETRAHFVTWVRESTTAILADPEAQKTSLQRKNRIDNLLQDAQGYEKITELLLTASLPPH